LPEVRDKFPTLNDVRIHSIAAAHCAGFKISINDNGLKDPRQPALRLQCAERRSWKCAFTIYAKVIDDEAVVVTSRWDHRHRLLHFRPHIDGPLTEYEKRRERTTKAEMALIADDSDSESDEEEEEQDQQEVQEESHDGGWQQLGQSIKMRRRRKSRSD
jgi:hypothetical protein